MLSLKFLNKKEIKIFLTFFIIYFLFIHWGGWYENSIFALTRAIVNEGGFEIDSFANQTSDRAFFNNHYYTDKAPGTSLLLIPVYGLWKFIYYNGFPYEFIEKYSASNDYNIVWSNQNTTIISYVNPGFFIFMSMILITIFTVTLFTALTVVLIYKISEYFTKNENHRMLITIIYGLGSLAVPSALSIYTHATATFFLFFAFFILLKIKKKELNNKNYFFIAGLLLGFAETVDFLSFLAAVPLVLYAIFSGIFKNKKNFIIFLIAGLLGLLPLVLYNFSITGNFFEFVAKYTDRNIFSEVPENVFNSYGFLVPNIGVVFQILFGTYRGLFFYYPIFLLSLLGIYYGIKSNKAEIITISIIFVLFIVANSLRITWHGGYTFGPRYLLLSIPFLTIPILFTFKDLKEKIPKIVIGFLIIFSIFVNLLGLQTLEDSITNRENLLIDEKYKNETNNFQKFPNVLFYYYLPLFLNYGPKSLIIENLAEGHWNIDIRDISLSREWKIPFLSLIIIGMIIFLIWMKELRNLLYFQIIKKF
jgi:hypothetical protein